VDNLKLSKIPVKLSDGPGVLTQKIIPLSIVPRGTEDCCGRIYFIQASSFLRNKQDNSEKISLVRGGQTTVTLVVQCTNTKKNSILGPVLKCNQRTHFGKENQDNGNGEKKSSGGPGASYEP